MRRGILARLPDRDAAMNAELWANSFLWVKTLHIVFVIAWMAAVFYMPRLLVNIVEAGDAPAVRDRLVLMGRRLYRFGHIMLGIAFVLGLTLWLHFKVPAGGWLHAKLALVIGLVAYYVISGRWLKGAAAGRPLPGARTLRWFNELPVLVLVLIVYLVLAKPF